MLECKQFVAETTVEASSLTTKAGYPVSLSVYYANRPKTGLSPLYKYCLAKETAESAKAISTLISF